jgi:hypothetical protein
VEDVIRKGRKGNIIKKEEEEDGMRKGRSGRCD